MPPFAHDTGTPLWDLANRNYKCKLSFEIADNQSFHSGGIRFPTGWMTIMPNHISPNTRLVNRDEFLKIVLITNHQFTYTVKEMIRAGSHYLGGVHNGEPENPSQASMNAFYLHTKDHANILFFAVKAISIVVTKAMQPLVDAINKQKAAAG